MNTSPPPQPVLQTEPALQSALDEKFQDSGLEVVTSTSSYGAMPNIRPLQSSRDVGVPMATVRYGGEKGNTKSQGQVGPTSDDVVAAKLADFEEQLKGVGGGDNGGRSAHQGNTKRNNHRSTSRSSSHSGGGGYGGDRDAEKEAKPARRGTKKDRTTKSRSSKDIAEVAAAKGGENGSKESSSRLSSIHQDIAAPATGAAAATKQSQPKPSLLRRISNGPKEMFRRLSNGNLMAAGAGDGDNDDLDDEAPDRTNLVVDTSAGGHSPRMTHRMLVLSVPLLCQPINRPSWPSIFSRPAMQPMRPRQHRLQRSMPEAMPEANLLRITEDSHERNLLTMMVWCRNLLNFTQMIIRRTKRCGLKWMQRLPLLEARTLD